MSTVMNPCAEVETGIGGPYVEDVRISDDELVNTAAEDLLASSCPGLSSLELKAVRDILRRLYKVQQAKRTGEYEAEGYKEQIRENAIDHIETLLLIVSSLKKYATNTNQVLQECKSDLGKYKRELYGSGAAENKYSYVIETAPKKSIYDSFASRGI